MPHVEELHLYAKEYNAEEIAASSALTHLRVLRMYHLGFGGNGDERPMYAYPLNLLAANPALANLTHLLLHPHYDESYGDAPESFLPLAQIRAVVTSPHLTKLTHLQARMSDMGDNGCRMLVETGAMRRLKWLDLRHGRITDEGACILADCPDVRHLEHLDLSRNVVTEAGLALLWAAGVNARAESPYTEQELVDHKYLKEGDFE
jgi:hypothetical protein